MPSNSSKPTPSSKKSFSATTPRNGCVACQENHRTYQCGKFLALTPQKRFEIVKKARACANCFGQDHTAKECTCRACKKCDKKHNTLLHFEVLNENQRKETTGTKVTEESPKSSVSESNVVAKMCAEMTTGQTKVIALPTAVVHYVAGNSSGYMRILFDSASQTTAISDVFVRKRKIATRRSSVQISGVGGMVSSSHSCLISLVSRHSPFKISVVADVITASAITYHVPEGEIKFIQRSNLIPSPLAENMTVPYSNVDLILGAEYYERCVLNNTIHVDGIAFRDTQFGWTMSGPVPTLSCRVKSSNLACCTTIMEVQDQLQKFWAMEEVEEVSEKTEEHALCDAHFTKTFSRDTEGRFVVRLPFKTNPSCLGESKLLAHRSLLRGERSSNTELRNQYVGFMQEYLQLNHMSLIPEKELAAKPYYYIPHKAVSKPTSTTTKLRVVFNASAKSSTGISLNDVLMSGPKLQNDIFDVIIRFRSHRIGFAADITKMYRQIWVDKRDRDFQRILWRDTPFEPEKHYQLNTLTYGTTPASYIATKCLAVLADEIASVEPVAARAISSDFYMDDILTGANDVESALKLQSVIHSTLLKGCFPLRKYISNSQSFLQTIEPDLVEQCRTFDLMDHESVLVLGLVWEPPTDHFRIKLNVDMESISTINKRVILSIGARIFDPIGILAPVTIRFKLLLQELWKLQLDWDEQVPEEVSTLFCDYVHDLSVLKHLVIRRPYTTSENIVKRQIVGFCDSSTRAFCAVVYVRTWNSDNNVSNYFCCSKTRVAPIKSDNIHRLELEAALLLTKLVVRVARVLNIELKTSFLYSDSRVALSWLAKPPITWSTFVCNRVRKVQDHFDISNWSYVNTAENPADLGTRGLKASKLKDSDLWLAGPLWLSNINYVFEPFVSNNSPDNMLEICKTKLTCNSLNVSTTIIDKFSSFTRLLRVTTRILRLRRKPLNPTPSELTIEECNHAFVSLLKLVQGTSFADEIHLLKSGKSVRRRSKLWHLQPYIDENGLLRISGRLARSSLSLDRKHPIILPAKTHFIVLYARHLHEKYFHATKSFIIAYLAARFHFVNGINSVIKTIIRKCVQCARYRGITATQVMGQLPRERVNPSPPFTNVGVDFAGPFEAKCVGHRSTIRFKTYLCLFVCFATRAVHLEITSDLSTAKYLEAFNRFTARRGKPLCVWSDNGPNFVSASNFLRKEGIHCKFIPPHAPHQGGLWEASVKSAKARLLHATRGRTCTFEEYATLFARVEAILNSRPLCRSSKGDSEEVLTPGHFLTGNHLLMVPEECTSATLSERLVLQRSMIQAFWNKWSSDYLAQLNQQTKWHKIQPNLKEGEVVLVKDRAKTSFEWPLARVEIVHPDQDGLVRAVDVRCNGTLYRRPITRIVRLPIDLPD